MLLKKNRKQIIAYPKMGAEKVSHDERETKQYGLRGHSKQAEKGMKYRRKINTQKNEVLTILICLTISSANMTKSAVFCQFGRIY